MKKTLIIIIAMCLIFLFGCTGGPIVPAEKLDVRTTGNQEAGNTPEQTDRPSVEPSPTTANGVRYCSFPDEYAKLEEFYSTLVLALKTLRVKPFWNQGRRN